MPFCDTCGNFLDPERDHPRSPRDKEICNYCAPRKPWEHPQFVTECEYCGKDGVRLHSCQVHGLDLEIDECQGFALSDAKRIDTTYELVHCRGCDRVGPLRLHS